MTPEQHTPEQLTPEQLTPEQETPGTTTTCSAKGCQATALHDLRWNNPKIHTPDRRKHWLACEQHRTSLSDFLGARGFLREVVPLG